jgi:DNA-binding SARP family transcriptional activator/Tfp pilus assembly protein PilF
VGVRFCVLGPVEVHDGARPIRLPGLKQRALLAALLCRPGRPVSREDLADVLWPQARPAAAFDNIRSYVHHLRRALGEGRVLRSDGGYRIDVRPGELDAAEFSGLALRGSAALAAGRPREASDWLHEALSLWRGAAFAEMTDTALIAAEASQLEERRLAVLEDRIEADLALGGHAVLSAELPGLVAAYPLRERLRAQLMTALYRSGRQAEALQAYQSARTVLVSDLGVEPGPALVRLQQAILNADPGLELPAGPTPGAAGLAPVPAQLPREPGYFTGREKYLRRLDDLAHGAAAGDQQAGIIVITGTPGVGKTALAVRWAHRIRDRFRDGQLYADLRGYSSRRPMRPVAALGQLLRGLGTDPAVIPAGLDEAASLYRTMLAGRKVLILLDNAASAEQVRPLIPGNPGCLVVVTSRDRLSGLAATDGAEMVGLDVLDHEEAIELLVRAAGREGLETERETAAELARLCACLPLALRVAAANLATRPQQAAADYATELAAGDRLAALRADDDERAAVAAAFGLSYRRLPTAAQRLFRLLGLVPGPDFTVPAAAVLAGLPAPEAERLMGRLAAVHLLGEYQPGRYQFHDLLRLYARQRAQAHDTPAARREATARLTGWYLRGADEAARLLYPEMVRLPVPGLSGAADADGSEAASDARARALAWLDAERANLMAAIEQAGSQRPHATAWLLADTLRGYFYQRWHIAEWLAAARCGLGAARAADDLPGQAASHLSLGHAYWSQRRQQQAMGHYQAALALSRQAPWPECEATALGNLGIAYWDTGQLEQAIGHTRRALAVQASSHHQATKLANLGYWYWSMGELRQAAGHLTRALALARSAGHQGSEAHALANLGLVHRDLGQAARALDDFGLALTLCRDIGDQAGEADAYAGLASANRDSGRHQQALALAGQAAALACRIGDPRTEIDALNVLATTYQRLGRHHEARRHHERARALAADSGTRFQQAETLLGLAAAYQGLGQHERSSTCAREGLAIARHDGYGLLWHRPGQSGPLPAPISPLPDS